MSFLINYFDETVYLLRQMAPYLLLGFLIAGILKYGFRQKKIKKWLGGSNSGSVINASLLGVPMPLCSCGVIPTGVSLYRSGASRGSTLSFLISTPQTGVDSILATYSLLGLPFAVIRPVTAFITGIAGGIIGNKVEKEKTGESHNATISDGDFLRGWKRIAAIFKYAYYDFMKDIAKWLLVGILIAGLISTLLPDDFFLRYLENDYLSMLVMLVASIPLYICATGSVPIAAVLLAKGLSPGAALVFLMAGPATNAAAITVIGKTLGRKSLIIYLLTIIIGSLLAGTLMNEFLPTAWFNVIPHGNHGHSMLPDFLLTGSAILLTGLIFLSLIGKFTSKKPQCKGDICMNNTTKLTIKIGGMSCSHCVSAVTKALTSLDNVKSVFVNLESGTAEIDGTVNLKEVKDTIKQLGYQFKGVL